MRLLSIIATFCLTTAALAQTNLVPNPSFDAKNPLEGWRIDFPYEGWYVENASRVRATEQGGRKCVVLDLPPGIAGNQGGKIETSFIPAEPGATYRVEVDCMTADFSAKLHVEAWTKDPKPVDKPDKFRVPASAEGGPLVMCYRAQIPDPPGGSHQWTTVSRELTLPKTVRVAGQEQKPELLTIKAVVYAGTMKAGKSYFTNFRLYKIKPPKI